MLPKTLLITDRTDLAKLHASVLLFSGLEVVPVSHTLVMDGRIPVEPDEYNLVVLNLFDEESANFELCQTLRDIVNCPLLVMLYQGDERVVLSLYEAGADDCLIQPMSIHLLKAKFQAWLRRTGAAGPKIEELQASSLRFDLARNEVITPENLRIRLSNQEARLLQLLMSNPGQLVETEDIAQRVWTENTSLNRSRTLVKVLVHRLRRKLEGDAGLQQYIHSVANQGYTFRCKN